MGLLRELVITFLCLAVIFWLLDPKPGGLRAQFRRPGYAVDAFYWFFNPEVTSALIGMMTSYAIVLFVHLTDFRSRIVSDLPAMAQVGIVLVLGDLASYWLHRAFHHRTLWPFHAVHHSSVELDWLSAVRFHPVNDIAIQAKQVLLLALLGVDASILSAYVPFLTFFTAFQHANIELRTPFFHTVLAGPRFHRWHHTMEAEGRDKNFANLFPIWDWIFGTYYVPEGREPANFGTRELTSDRFLDHLRHPFRKRD